MLLKYNKNASKNVLVNSRYSITTFRSHQSSWKIWTVNNNHETSRNSSAFLHIRLNILKHTLKESLLHEFPYLNAAIVIKHQKKSYRNIRASTDPVPSLVAFIASITIWHPAMLICSSNPYIMRRVVVRSGLSHHSLDLLFFTKIHRRQVRALKLKYVK